MTDAEEVEFLGLWLIDIGQSMRDLSAAVQQCFEKLRREIELADYASPDRKAGDLQGLEVRFSLLTHFSSNRATIPAPRPESGDHEHA